MLRIATTLRPLPTPQGTRVIALQDVCDLLSHVTAMPGASERRLLGAGSLKAVMKEVTDRKLLLVPVAGDGHCFYRAVALAMYGDKTDEKVLQVREWTASSLDVERCEANADGAFTDEWPPETFPRRCVSSAAAPAQTFRFVNPLVRPITDTILQVLMPWVSGEHSPEGFGTTLIDRLKNNFGVDAQSTPTLALSARQIYIRSPKDLFPDNPDRISYADALEIFLLEAILKVRISLLSAYADAANVVTLSRSFIDGSIVQNNDDRLIVTLAHTPNHFDALRTLDLDEVAESDSDSESSISSDSEDDGVGAAAAATSTTSTTSTISAPSFREDPYIVALEGREFSSRADVVAFVRQLATNELRGLAIRKSDERRVAVVCTEERDPTRAVLVFKPNVSGEWSVVVNESHFCASAGRPAKYDKRTPEELLSAIHGLLNGPITIKTVHAALRAIGVRVEKSKLSRIVDMAHKRMYGDEATNYATLRAFLLQHQAADSSFYFHIESSMVDGAELFERLFVAPGYAGSFTAYCSRACMADACHAKVSGGGGIFIVTVVPIVGVSLNAASKSTTIVVAISKHNSTETNKAWEYHLDQLRLAGLFAGVEPVITVTDNRAGLRELVERLPTAGLAPFISQLDVPHLARMVAAAKDDKKNKIVHMSWVAVCSILARFAVVRTEHELNELLNDLFAEKPKSDLFKRYDLAPRRELRAYMFNVLLRSDMRSRWMSLYVRVPRLDIYHSQSVESFNAVLLKMGARHAPIRAAFSMILQYLAERFDAVKRFIGIDAPEGLSPDVMPIAVKPFYGTLGQRALEQRQLLSGVGRVQLALDSGGRANGNAIVQMLHGQTAFSVNWAARTCTCGMPQTLGVPCVHVFAVAREEQAPLHMVAQFTARGVMRAHLLSAMQHKIEPVAIDMSSLQRDGLRKGPVVLADGTTQSTAAKRGRPPAEKRILSTGEELSSAQPEKKKKPQVCGKCKQPGHNKARCGQQ